MRMWIKDSENAEKLSEEGIEVWHPFPDAPDRIRVSNLGRVSTKVAGRDWYVLKNTTMDSGYLAVGLYTVQGAAPTTRTVHRLILSVFNGAPPTSEHTDVRHLNGNKADCRLCNLRYGTRSENMKDVWKHRQEGLPAAENRPAVAESDNRRSWYAGYTDDTYLLKVGLEFLNERKLTISDLTRLWNCSVDIANNIVRGETRKDVFRSEPPKKQLRRSPQQKDRILMLVQEGLSVAEINVRLGETLTAQDVYYYKTRDPSVAVDKTNERMSDETVLAILQMAKDTGWGAPRIGKHFGKSTATISSILAGTSYKHVPRPSRDGK